MLVRERVCPQCRGLLRPVYQHPSSALNRDQYESQRPGDFYCPACPPNGRGKASLCYWWERELPVAHDYQI